MILLVIAIVALGFIAALFELYSKHQSNDDQSVKWPTNACATCTTVSSQCEQACMMEAATKEIEYYNDEELDVFIGRASDNYTDEEDDQFEEVLTTMNPKEVAGWNRSLILRGINLPNQIKDEVIMAIAENP